MNNSILHIRTLVWFRLLLLCLNVRACFNACAQPLPKTIQATAINVFDMTQELSAQNEYAMEVFYADLAIQGLVNRTNTTKIYFSNCPVEWSWTYPPGSGNLVQWPADAAQLNDGLIPVPQSKPILSASLTYPVLSCLVTNYVKKVKLITINMPVQSRFENDEAQISIKVCIGELHSPTQAK